MHRGVTKGALVIVLNLASCTPGPRAVYERMKTPDGGHGYLIECKQERGNCLYAAGRLCPSGYRIFDSEGGQVTTGAYALHGKYATTTFVGHRYEGSILVACNGREPKPRPSPSPAQPDMSPAEGRPAVEQPCGDRTGNYRVQRTRRTGTCDASANEEIVTLDDEPLADCRTITRSPDGCEVRTIDDCTAGTKKVEVTRWTPDTSSAKGMEELSFFNAGPARKSATCTFDVTYSRL